MIQKNIFYSWQSDLPNSQNRGFIQECIEIAIKEIIAEKLHLEIVIDRDTIGISGTPDIAASIFSKIDAASIFIADVSIINSNDASRKTPNPNVAIELGYAAKSLGWDRVISIFNSSVGSVEDLPFDLRFRRPIIYTITNQKNKTKDRKLLAERIKEGILSIIRQQTTKDEIFEYMKQQIDKDVLSITNSLHKLLNGYDERLSSTNMWALLSMTQEDVVKNLFEKKLIGFTVLKDWEGSLRHLQQIINQPMFSQHALHIHTAALVKIARALEMIISITHSSELFINTGMKTSGYQAKRGKDLNTVNPENTFLLLKMVNNIDGVVVDSGNIKPFNQPKLLYTHVINHRDFHNYALAIHSLLVSLNYWVQNSGNTIIIGPSYT